MDLSIPIPEEAERREQRRAIRRHVRQLLAQRGNRVRFVEAEDFTRGVGAVPESVPDLPLLIALAAEEHVPVTVRTGQQRDHRLGFRNPDR